MIRKSRSTYAALASLFRGGVFVPIVCYADESGTHDESGRQPGSRVAVVAGLVAWKDQWDTFTRLWQDALDEYGIEVFHYADFANEKRIADDPDSPYFGWERERRDRFIHRLVVIARDNTLFGASGLVDVQAYDQILPDSLKRNVEHPYHFCSQLFFDCSQLFFDCLQRTIEGNFGDPFPTGERIEFFFDRQDRFKDGAIRRYDSLMKMRATEKYFGGISFQDKSRYIPLQAADLLAGRMRIVFTRQISGQIVASAGGWDDEFGAKKNMYMNYYDAEHIRHIFESQIRGVWKGGDTPPVDGGKA